MEKSHRNVGRCTETIEMIPIYKAVTKYMEMKLYIQLRPLQIHVDGGGRKDTNLLQCIGRKGKNSVGERHHI